MSKELATRALFADALAGRIDRRTLLARAAALGLSAPVAAALANETARTALAGEEGTLEITYYDWIIDLHPDIERFNTDFNATFPLEAEIAPTANFGIDRFLAEAAEKTSTWDMYIGVTPFLEMIQMVESDVIEPWDPYLPEGLLDRPLRADPGRGDVQGQVLRLAVPARRHRPGLECRARQGGRTRSRSRADDLGRVPRQRAEDCR